MSQRTIHRFVFAAALLFLIDGSIRGADEPAPVHAQLLNKRGGLGNFFQKVQAGKELKVAYLGGSITAAQGWRVKSLEWLKTTYPNAKFVEINAAIGGTGSELGAYRLQQDVLRHQPDLLFVEFAVNDGGTLPESIYRSMEGIVRQTWKADPATDICFVYTLAVNQAKDYEKGFCSRSASADEKIAEHYAIPSMNFALKIAELAKAGKLEYQVPAGTKSEKIIFSHDGVHPVDAGHAVYRDVVADGLTAMAGDATAKPHTLSAPFREGSLENVRMVPIVDSMASGDWKKLPTDAGLGKTFNKWLPQLWESGKPGDSLSVKFRGTSILLYDVVGPNSCQVSVSIDGKEGVKRSRFDKYCASHRLSVLPIASGLPDGEHTVAITVLPEAPDKSEVMKTASERKDYDPKKFAGLVLRPGYWLINGEVVSP